MSKVTFLLVVLCACYCAAHYIQYANAYDNYYDEDEQDYEDDEYVMATISVIVTKSNDFAKYKCSMGNVGSYDANRSFQDVLSDIKKKISCPSDAEYSITLNSQSAGNNMQYTGKVGDLARKGKIGFDIGAVKKFVVSTPTVVKNCKESYGYCCRVESSTGNMYCNYQLGYVECGDFKAEAAIQDMEAKRKAALKRMDPFERIKCELMQLIANTNQLIKQSKEEENNKRLNNTIRMHIGEAEKLHDKLKAMHARANKKNMYELDGETHAQRQEDVLNAAKHIQYLKNARKGAALLGKKKEYQNKPNFTSVDNLQQEEEALPTIDISEGLAIIEENKKKQNELLDGIENQLDKMKEIASNFKNELEVENMLLNKIEKDVSKYDEQLNSLNGKLDKAVAAVGGSCRLVFILIAVIVCLAVIGIVYVAVNNAIRGVSLT